MTGVQPRLLLVLFASLMAFDRRAAAAASGGGGAGDGGEGV